MLCAAFSRSFRPARDVLAHGTDKMRLQTRPVLRQIERPCPSTSFMPYEEWARGVLPAPACGGAGREQGMDDPVEPSDTGSLWTVRPE